MDEEYGDMLILLFFVFLYIFSLLKFHRISSPLFPGPLTMGGEVGSWSHVLD